MEVVSLLSAFCRVSIGQRPLYETHAQAELGAPEMDRYCTA